MITRVKTKMNFTIPRSIGISVHVESKNLTSRLNLIVFLRTRCPSQWRDMMETVNRGYISTLKRELIL